MKVRWKAIAFIFFGIPVIVLGVTPHIIFRWFFRRDSLSVLKEEIRIFLKLLYEEIKDIMNDG